MNTLSPLIRKKAEWISVVCGIVGGALANSERSNAIVLWIVSASMIAGAVGNFSADAGDDPGLRPRAGIRSGVLTAVIAGAVAVLGFTIRSPFRGFAVVLPALLAIPPGAFFGMLGSLVVSMIQNPPVRPLGASDAREQSRPSVLLITILLGSVTGYLSPLIAVLLPAPAPRVVSSPVVPTPAPRTPTPTPAPPPRPAQPPPPHWRYETPAGFADAHPSQLHVLKEVSLGVFERPFRFAFARDGRTFAFARSDSAITVLDLNEPETTVSFFVPETPERFAFGPDGKRLFCITANGGKFVVSRERAIRLPLPASALNGSLDWAENTRVFVGDKVLDLDTLQLSPAPGNRPSPPLASHPHIRLRPGRRITSVQESRLETQTRHVFADANRDYSILTPATAELVFLSADATKLFLVGNRELAVVYFELRAAREMKFTADMKAAPPASIADALKTRNLIAVLCPPVINPLNDKPVGADLSRVKAVLGVESWEGQTATLFVKEDYGMKAEDGDAVALLLNTGHGRSAIVEGFENWWSLVRDVTAGDAPVLIAPSEPVPPKPGETPQAPQPVGDQRNASVSQNVVDVLRIFIHAHHAKSTRGDVDALVADYADRVDHLKGSVVDRETIRKEELDYHSPGTRVSEVVVGEIKVSAVNESLFRANYTIRYEQIRPSGAWARGFSDIELLIDMTLAPPRKMPVIVRQRANNRDKQKGP
jgi:hypothetical protein